MFAKNSFHGLNQEPQPVNDETRIIVVEIASQVFGLLVDEVEAVLQLPMDHIESSPTVLKGLDPRYIYGVGKYQERLITVLHLENIMENINAHEILPAEAEEET